MAIFQYQALDAKGNETKGEIEALSSKEAISKIRNKGLFPTKVRAQNVSKKAKVAREAAGPKRRGANGKVKIKAVTQFARQMSTLQDAGLAILRSLRILEEQQKKGTFKRVIGYVADEIEGGATLSEAMSHYPRCFNRLFVNMVAAGEVGGVLDVILNRVADFMEKSERLKSKIKGAMVYPAVVMTAAFFIVMGLMIFIVPTFSEVLKDMSDGKAQLPGLTRGLLAISNWLLGRKGLNAALVAVCPFVVFSLLKLVRQFRYGRYAMDWLKLHTPIIKKLVYKTSVARWTRTLATLISAGVPILEALNITRETSENEIYSAMLAKVQAAIRQGDTFANPLRQSKTVDSIVVNMVDVGEETGDLDKMLLKIADNFDEEADVLVGSLMSMLEPIMIIMLGGLVGTIVLAMFLPMVKMIQVLM
ncbi:MAG TPA: type II secretion system F family protein [Anaerohalosphaeraceae bacterium]|nr:type II secretion system F family protein [Phycisphaerae bacterium]HOK96616.1 type II secretion system F family protein [Anaerohalosphaeraceae bacterium]HOL31154.1 type II secretion system F family protein [Anaerohalosphaeraceae bacterium]HOM75859.1 type II secretion system F family protein [Anaerohalosphaeraceae bacterium]HPC63481.1 type II secretion system F family protein [Anaerohalosphaeraceae bacterium]